MGYSLLAPLPVPRFLRYTWPLWLFLAIFGAGGLFIAYDQLSPQAIQVQAALQAEAHAIPPPPGTQVHRVSATHHRARALVSVSYISELRYPEIRAYYDRA